MAAIVIVAYNGIQTRAYNTAIQTDLKSIAKKLELYKVENDAYPLTAQLVSGFGLKASKSAYGPGFAGLHNLLYCRVAATGPVAFALIAESKSGTVYTYKSATNDITSATAWLSTSSVTNCQNAGIDQTIGTDRDIFYYNGAWQSYVGG